MVARYLNNKYQTFDGWYLIALLFFPALLPWTPGTQVIRQDAPLVVCRVVFVRWNRVSAGYWVNIRIYREYAAYIEATYSLDGLKMALCISALLLLVLLNELSEIDTDIGTPLGEYRVLITSLGWICLVELFYKKLKEATEFH